MKEALQLFAEEGSKIDVASNNNPGQGLAENKTARDILYHVENLRKRPGADD
jgi:tRNA (guanine-N(7)-)-methyltransferase subunit TRM82